MKRRKNSFKKVHIDESAFVALVTAALEAYDKETLGTLIGSIYKKKVIIKNAVAYQYAIRKTSEVSIWPAKEKKARDAINVLTGYKILGDFHSHPDCTPSFSKHDRIDMIETGQRLSLLIAVEEAERRVQWHYNKKDKCLRGTLGGEFLITIKLYAREHSSRYIWKLPIECPFAFTLNKKERY